ncbi:MAG: type I pullulanase [Treponema sp.]|nr:type I pullulanase [Treponema sp.]
MKKKTRFESAPMGSAYSPLKTSFRVWAPGADSVEVLLYASGNPDECPRSHAAMKREDGGFWYAEVGGDIKNTYYVYRVTRNGTESPGAKSTKQSCMLATDPYAKALGVNGKRGMVLCLEETDPPGFRIHAKPPLAAPTDSVIYEAHVRDLSMHPHSGIKHRGKYAGLAERGTVNAGPEFFYQGKAVTTGLDHIRELGITHIHLLPVYDFGSVDEAKSISEYNWGYDPENYNAPEGSYSTDPFDGAVRIREFKTMVQTLHEEGIRVIMDVVYNHVYSAGESNFEILAPGYFFRMNADGTFSNGSGCGNETASEREMMRKFMVESLRYWADEYRIDGFRFDLMGLHDIETMNIIRWELDKIDPSIIMYGEGWAAEDSPLAEDLRALKKNGRRLNERIGFFSDDMRDGIRGSVMIGDDTGFVNGCGKRAEDIKFGIVAAVEHPQVDIEKVRYSKDFWAGEPSRCINYASSHDDHCLWDKLKLSAAGSGDDELLALNKLSAAIVLSSQGIPFFLAGEEMARTKGGVKNSFKSPDSVNMLDWDRKAAFMDLWEYYRGLILLRKTYRAFTLRSSQEIRKRLRFFETDQGIAYSLNGEGFPPPAAGSPYSRFIVIFNPSVNEMKFSLRGGRWDLLVNGRSAGIRPLDRLKGRTAFPGTSAFVLGKV